VPRQRPIENEGFWPASRAAGGCAFDLRDKDRVIKAAFRGLKPDGRFAVCDVIVRGEVPAAGRKNMELWVGCVAGAPSDREYVATLTSGGFADINIETTRVYRVEDARTFLAGEPSSLHCWLRRRSGGTTGTTTAC
jgi:hypothetical protein